MSVTIGNWYKSGNYLDVPYVGRATTSESSSSYVTHTIIVDSAYDIYKLDYSGYSGASAMYIHITMTDSSGNTIIPDTYVRNTPTSSGYKTRHVIFDFSSSPYRITAGTYKVKLTYTGGNYWHQRIVTNDFVYDIRSAGTTGIVHIASGGAWNEAVPYIAQNGTWTQVQAYIANGGSWNIGT